MPHLTYPSGALQMPYALGATGTAADRRYGIQSAALLGEYIPRAYTGKIERFY